LMWWEDFDGKIPIFTILEPMEMTMEISKQILKRYHH
jgi:hypothetical protein